MIAKNTNILDPHVQVNDQFHLVTYITWTKQILKAILGPAAYSKSQISGTVAEAAEAMPWPIRLPAHTVAQHQYTSTS